MRTNSDFILPSRGEIFLSRNASTYQLRKWRVASTNIMKMLHDQIRYIVRDFNRQEYLNVNLLIGLYLIDNIVKILRDRSGGS